MRVTIIEATMQSVAPRIYKDLPDADYTFVPPVNEAVRATKKGFITARNLGSVNDTPSILFDIGESETTLLDLKQSPIWIDYRVESRDDAAADWGRVNHQAGESPDLTIVNNILHSMFSQVDILINEALQSRTTNLYQYQAYLMNLLNYSREAKKSWGRAIGFAMDTTAKFDSLHDQNAGGYARRARIYNGRTDTVTGTLFIPVMQDRALLPTGTKVTLSLTKGPVEFLLKHKNPAKEYRINILNAQIQVKRVTPDDFYFAKINQQLARPVGGFINLDYVHPCYKTLQPLGKREYIFEILNGKVPNELVIAFIEDDAYNGHNTMNPFNFKHHDLQSIQVQVDDELYPTDALKMDYAENSYEQAYDHLYRNMGQYGKQTTCGLRYGDMVGGSCIYVFNLRPNDTDFGSSQPPGRTGVVSLKLRFANVVDTTINAIVLRAYNSQIYIDQRRNFTGMLLTH